jgi:hypothetical protein
VEERPPVGFDQVQACDPGKQAEAPTATRTGSIAGACVHKFCRLMARRRKRLVCAHGLYEQTGKCGEHPQLQHSIARWMGQQPAG